MLNQIKKMSYFRSKNRIKTIYVNNGNRTAFYNIEDAIKNLREGYSEEEAFELAKTEFFMATPRKNKNNNIPLPSIQETAPNINLNESTIKFQNMINENFTNTQNMLNMPNP